MPRILRIINRLNLGGPAFNVANLSHGLAPEFETLVLSGEIDTTEASAEFILKEKGIHAKYIKGMRREISPLHDMDAYKQIVSVIKEFKPDIVHTHAAKAGTLGRLAAWNAKVPVIVHTFHGHVFHSYFSPLKTRVFIGIERSLARVSHAIVAISDVQKQDLVDKFKIAPSSKTHVIPLGFDLNRFDSNKAEKRISFRNQFKLKDDCIAVGLIGRIVPVKNHSMFLNAWKSITDNIKVPVHAFIVGDGEDRDKTEMLCRELGIIYNTREKTEENATLTFTSWMEDVDRVMAGLDVVALTSFNEGTPVSLIEAQAAGKPVVSTEVGGIKDAVIPGGSAFLVASDDIRGFSLALKTLLEDPGKRMEMGKAGTRFVMEKFDVQRLTRDMRTLYHQLLSQNPHTLK